VTGVRQHADETPAAVPAVPAPQSEAAPGPALTPAALLRLQSTAGNRAVTRHLLARQPTVTPTGPPATTGAPPAPADVPGRSKVLDPPDPTPNVAAGKGDDDAVHPAVDLAADASNVTVTLVLRNFNLPASGDASTIDFLHEPGVSIQISPGTPQPVVQAAIAAINVHLKRHGKDLVELSVSPQGSLDSTGKPQGGLQGQAELHVTASFSITAATSVSVSPHSDSPDPGSVPLPSPSRQVDLRWAPMSVGVLFHLDAEDKKPDRGPGIDWDAVKSDTALLSWVVNQLDRADFASPALKQLEPGSFVEELLRVMRTGAAEPQWTIHLGEGRVGDIPAGLTRGLTRAAQLIAGADQSAAAVGQVRVSILMFAPGSKTESVVRFTVLPVAGQAVKPAP
jgi:hypothetical protein